MKEKVLRTLASIRVESKFIIFKLNDLYFLAWQLIKKWDMNQGHQKSKKKDGGNVSTYVLALACLKLNNVTG